MRKRGYKYRLNSGLKGVIVFTIAFIVGVLAMKVLDRVIAERVIARDAQVLLQKFKMYLNDSNQQLSALPNLVIVDNQCSAEQEQAIKDTLFNANFVRWIAVTTPSHNMICQTGTIERNITSLDVFEVSQGLSVAVANDVDSVGHELFLVRHMRGFDYVASITPLRPRYFVPVECQGCLKYRVSLNTNPRIEFGNQSFVGKGRISHTIVEHQQGYSATFELTGNKEFLEQYAQFEWYVSFIVGFLSGVIGTLLYWRWNHHRNSIEQQIRQGVSAGEFIPFYQPIVDSRRNELVGVEILMRWQRDKDRFIPPNQFIPFAEDTGLISDMTASMLEHVFDDIKAFGSDVKPLFFSLNIVPSHLDSDDIVDYVESLRLNRLLQQHKLSLEITERYPIRDMKRARAVSQKLSRLGVDLKLDDAGTGYGSFSYIQNLNISTLKIDKMFVDTIGQQDSFNRSTLDAIVAFAKESQLALIAEGVETSEQLDYLNSVGVELIQGYYYSKPLQGNELMQWFNDSSLE
ncbi:EAL domain-containing protein [Paraferrimonas haliotis]|uniref:Signaling protein with EAL and C2 domains n=1 Tax=Paraferrimonas haliotis TaxID=2013866 RepID=A0AA37TW30_9GAMM|nr:EAL domain-containing protein [Paraferrimonas haliotis]GLS84129.1 signaling protein with EAL and C2 domains [Paraferrimonas haliotis]